ncbi:MAG: ArsR family transcriptional regulator [Thaumarchaeota archaeon]|nr:ArsR family transcriptional regulator [Nitrososphaerota archaeon]
MSTTENVKKFKIILDEAKKAKLESLSTWYSFFKMREDPFSPNIPSDDLNFFVNQEEIVNSVIFDIGVAKRGIPLVSFIVGPMGSGKSSILTYINTAMKQLSKQDPAYRFKGEFRRVEEMYESDEETDDLEEQPQKWVTDSVGRKDYYFFDDANPVQITNMMQNFVATNYKLFTVNPKHVKSALERLNVTPNIFYLRPLKIHDAKEMLNRRIKRALLDNETKFRIENIVEDSALKKMVKYCFGIPKLILKCASTSLQLLRQSHQEKRTDIGKITEELVELSCTRIKCIQAYNHYRIIGEHKSTILMKIIEKEKTPTEISSEIKKDRTTVSRHLSDLRELGLVEYYQRGRESYYGATEPVKILVEIDSMPKEKWPIGTD